MIDGVRHLQLALEFRVMGSFKFVDLVERRKTNQQLHQNQKLIREVLVQILSRKLLQKQNG